MGFDVRELVTGGGAQSRYAPNPVEWLFGVDEDYKRTKEAKERFTTMQDGDGYGGIKALAQKTGYTLSPTDFNDVEGTRTRLQDQFEHQELDKAIGAYSGVEGVTLPTSLPTTKAGKTKLLSTLQLDESSYRSDNTPGAIQGRELVGAQIQQISDSNKVTNRRLDQAEATAKATQKLQREQFAWQKEQAGNQAALAREESMLAREDRAAQRLSDLEMKQLDIQSKRAMHAEEIKMRNQNRREKRSDDLVQALMQLSTGFFA